MSRRCARAAKVDPYAMFEKMLERGNPAGRYWDSLVAAKPSDWSKHRRSDKPLQ